MPDEYYKYYKAFKSLDPNKLLHGESRQLLAACLRNDAFDVIDLYRLRLQSNPAEEYDGIEVDCWDGAIPTMNDAGIRPRERLMLVFNPAMKPWPYDVWALRKDFPPLIHLSDSSGEGAASLCLYNTGWSNIERTWTPASQLERIRWWLRESALGILHKDDQPPEGLHYVSNYQLVLPAKFFQRAAKTDALLRLEGIQKRDNGSVIRATFAPPDAQQATWKGTPSFDPLVIEADKMVAYRVERIPKTLGALHDQLTRHQSDLFGPLRDALRAAMPEVGLTINPPRATHTLIILKLPVAKAAADEPHRTDVSGFLVDASLAQLGLACEAYFSSLPSQGPSLAFVERLLGVGDCGDKAPPTAWRNFALEKVEVRSVFGRADARLASGVPDEGADFKGVLAGVGALGGTLADIWHREGWGEWCFIDDDLLHPHNIARHIGKDFHIGWPKVDIVAASIRLARPDEPSSKTVFAKVTDLGNTDVQAALSSASLLVDATTTLEAPRDLAAMVQRPRIASTFLTPSGEASVLLLENAAKTTRVNSLEAQYYRAIINSEWGEHHLAGHQGAYYVGAGCRDRSTVLSQELIHLHSATLARQLRLLSTNEEAQIRVWHLDDKTGALRAEVIPAEASHSEQVERWSVHWDDAVARKMDDLREAALPNETGGIVLGFFDQKQQSIHIVDVCAAPPDSKSSRTSFVRGTVGVQDAINQCANRTAGIVRYLGEWHSHPRNVPAIPSRDDKELIATLAKQLAVDDVPALMLIAGENQHSIHVKEFRLNGAE
ncbi:Mov34/MPN/PAD-1 family protein [Achromobacter denitrificans]